MSGHYHGSASCNDEDISRRCIYKVPEPLRKVKEEAYAPQLVSIGPLRRNNIDQYKSLEKIKEEYVEAFLNDKNNNGDQQTFLDIIKNRKNEIKECYEDLDLDDDDDELVKIFLEDSIFIIELFIRDHWEEKYAKDFIVSTPWRRNVIKQDLILLENQIPYFILEDLYNHAYQGQPLYPPFLNLTESYFSNYIEVPKEEQIEVSRDCWSCLYCFWFTQCSRSVESGQNQQEKESSQNQEENKNPQPMHFTDLSRCYRSQKHPSSAKNQQEKESSSQNLEGENPKPLHFTDLIRYYRSQKHPENQPKEESSQNQQETGQSGQNQREMEESGQNQQEKKIPQPMRFTDLIRCYRSQKHPSSAKKQEPNSEPPPQHCIELGKYCRQSPKSNKKNARYLVSATKLHEAGVTFKASEDKDAWPLGITLEGGVLSMPTLKVSDSTERLYRNLMAFEQCHYPTEAYICNYIRFIDELINTEDDVDLLIEKGVLVNSLGNNEKVANLFNDLNSGIVRANFCYETIFQRLNDHYGTCWYRAVATLRHAYFTNFWRGSGTVFAFILLILTLIQSIRSLMEIF
ncbi:UPF0481 protein At3g47200 isoform X1 [Hevea brasiliensis]|nr:UPF0481 protein At3g47200 isoform X1 [Hevea brasiliensis]